MIHNNGKFHEFVCTCVMVCVCVCVCVCQRKTKDRCVCVCVCVCEIVDLSPCVCSWSYHLQHLLGWIHARTCWGFPTRCLSWRCAAAGTKNRNQTSSAYSPKYLSPWTSCRRSAEMILREGKDWSQRLAWHNATCPCCLGQKLLSCHSHSRPMPLILIRESIKAASGVFEFALITE